MRISVPPTDSVFWKMTAIQTPSQEWGKAPIQNLTESLPDLEHTVEERRQVPAIVFVEEITGPHSRVWMFWS